MHQNASKRVILASLHVGFIISNSICTIIHQCSVFICIYVGVALFQMNGWVPHAKKLLTEPAIIKCIFCSAQEQNFQKSHFHHIVLRSTTKKSYATFLHSFLTYQSPWALESFDCGLLSFPPSVY